MAIEKARKFHRTGEGKDLDPEPRFSPEEIQLALRNRGIPLEGLAYDITPTGMHYLLVHFDIPRIEASTWRLEIGGLVERTLTLSLEDIRARPVVRLPVTLECGGNGRALMDPRPVSQPWLVEAVSTSEWTGTPLAGVLSEAGLKPEAVELVFSGADRGFQGELEHDYQRSLSIDDATRDEVMLAYEMNGRPLEPQHGFPLRLLVPGWYGMTSVKWLTHIEAVFQPFEGYQMVNTYRYTQTADDRGDPVSTIRVRSLMTPPGIPDFFTRTRVVRRGSVTLEGRAWAGRLDVSRVQVSSDGGATWEDAILGGRGSGFAWHGWSYEWAARPGEYELMVRAWDSAGNAQPVEQDWNYQGMGNNMCQRVRVVVE